MRNKTKVNQEKSWPVPLVFPETKQFPPFSYRMCPNCDGKILEVIKQKTVCQKCHTIVETCCW